jgi:hypothetical protein
MALRKGAWPQFATTAFLYRNAIMNNLFTSIALLNHLPPENGIFEKLKGFFDY